MQSDDAEVFVSRVFDRSDGEVGLFFYKPEPYPMVGVDADPNKPPWRCAYAIHFPDGETKRFHAVGIDSMQAFLLAVASAKGNLQYVGNCTPERRPPVHWLGEDDLGLTIDHFE